MNPTLYTRSAATRWSYRDIFPQMLAEPHTTARLVDVREADEFSSGHIPGSEHVSLADFPARLERWDKQQEIVLVCRCGTRSGLTAEAMGSAGFSRVMNLAGGFDAYRALGLPVERSAAA